MTGYKGTNKDMACTKGSGTFPYQLGLNRADQAKARSTGLHFTEDPFLVLNWYPLGSDNRYFLCEASGDINETDGEDSMACTELTIIRELTVKELAGHGMMFMLRHPLRGWEKRKTMLQVRKEQAEAFCAGSIAIARGRHPKVKGPAGSFLGLLREENGMIIEARLFEAGEQIKADTWYTLDGSDPKEVQE